MWNAHVNVHVHEHVNVHVHGPGARGQGPVIMMMMMLVCVFTLARADTLRIYIILLLRGTKYVVECIEHTPTEMKTEWIASDTVSAIHSTQGNRLRYMHSSRGGDGSNILRKSLTKIRSELRG